MSAPLPAVMAGRTVLITSHRRSDDLADAFTRRGAAVRHAAALSVLGHADDAQLLSATRALLQDPPDILVATTAVGVRGWLEAAAAAGLDQSLLAVLADVRIIARGAKTRGALRAHGLAPAWVAASETAAEVIEHLLAGDLRGSHVAVQHHGNGSTGIDEALAAAGARVSPFVVYRWGPAPDPQALTDSVVATADGEVDVVVFTSAPAVSAWFETVDACGATERIVSRSSSGELLFAAVGPVTAAPLVARGITPLIPRRSRMGALVRAVLDHHGADGR